jgi:hypothetical protein
MPISRTHYNALVDDSGAAVPDGTPWVKARVGDLLDDIDLIGVWISPAFDAADYTASGAMTWTLASGDVITRASMLLGKGAAGSGTLTVAWDLITTTIGGVVGTNLRMAIPGGYTAARTVTNAFAYQQAGVWATGYAQVVAGSTFISFYTSTFGTTNWALSTNLTYLAGQLTFEVQ